MNRRHAPFVAFWVVVFAVACSAPQVGGEAKLDPPGGGGFVWRGFEHTWSYNHRLNRMGGLLVDGGCVPAKQGNLPKTVCRSRLMHTGASGYGADELTFQSYYSRVTADGLGVRTGQVYFQFRGNEGQDLRGEETVRLPADELLAGRDRYVVLLNGYDIHVADPGKAKKVKQLKVWVDSNPRYDAESGTVQFQVGGTINLNCDSLECRRQPDRVVYDMRLRFVVLAADNHQLRETAKTFEAAYEWDRRDELEVGGIDLNAERQQIQGSEGGYAASLLGFRRLDFDLSKKGRYKDHWFVSWIHRIGEVDYRSETGTTSFDLDLLFKEWNAVTKSKVASMAKAGEADLLAEVVMVQLDEGRVEREKASGTIAWPGRNRSPDSDQAVWSKQLRFSF